MEIAVALVLMPALFICCLRVIQIRPKQEVSCEDSDTWHRLSEMQDVVCANVEAAVKALGIEAQLEKVEKDHGNRHSA